MYKLSGMSNVTTEEQVQQTTFINWLKLTTHLVCQKDPLRESFQMNSAIQTV